MLGQIRTLVLFKMYGKSGKFRSGQMVDERDVWMRPNGKFDTRCDREIQNKRSV